MAEDMARCHAGRTPWKLPLGLLREGTSVDASLQGLKEAPSSCRVSALATNKLNRGLPWWSRGCESACYERVHGIECLIWEDPMCCRATKPRHHNH